MQHGGRLQLIRLKVQLTMQIGEIFSEQILILQEQIFLTKH